MCTSLSALPCVLCLWPLACMQTESSLPRKALRDTHANDASGEHWSFLGQIVCLLVSYRTLAGLVLETSSGTLAGCARLRSVWDTPTASCSSAPRAPQLPRAKSIVYWQFGTRQPPRPKIQNDEHLLPLAGREPGPGQTRRGEPRGEPADHDAFREKSPARGPGPSGGIRTREFPVESGIRSLTQPETTHPS